MNYVDPSKITNLTHKQFIDEFDQAHKSQGISWDVVYEKVKQAAREVFIAAKLVHPEMKGEKVSMSSVRASYLVLGKGDIRHGLNV